MAWRQPGDKPLSKPMMVRLLTHICVVRPQWVQHHCFYNVHFDMMWWISHKLHKLRWRILPFNHRNWAISLIICTSNVTYQRPHIVITIKAIAGSVASLNQQTNCWLLSRVKAFWNSQFSWMIHTDSKSAVYIRAPVREPLVTSLANINILTPPPNRWQFAGDVFKNECNNLVFCLCLKFYWTQGSIDNKSTLLKV